MSDHTPPSSDNPGSAAADHVPPQRATDATIPGQTSPIDPWATTHQVPAHPADSNASMGSPWSRPDDGQPTVIDPTTGQPYAGGYATTVTPASSYVTFGDAPAEPRKGRRRSLVVSSVAVLALLVGVGAYAGVRAWTGAGIAEPETALPATVGAFARVDLNPGFGDKLNVNSLVKKFPTHGKSTTDVITTLETSISKEVGLDYNTDVKPWFAGQAGVAVWMDHGTPVTLIALASKDDAKAAATLTKLRQSQGQDAFGFAMENGYALIAGSQADNQAAATAAAKAVSAGTLADSATFKDTVSHVGDGNLLLAYADLGQLSSLATSVFGRMLGESGGDPLGGLDSSVTKATGRVAIGAKITDDGIEVRVHLGSSSAALTGTPALSTLGHQPSATIVGAAISGVDPSSSTAKELSQVLNGLSSGIGGAGSDDLFGGDPASESGLNVFDVLLRLLTAKQLSVAFTGISPQDMPNLLINVEARDQASAETLVDKVNQLTNGEPIEGLNITQSGPTVKATIGSPDITGSLGSSSLFKETMAGMSKSTSAVYVDVQKVLSLAGRATSSSDRAEIAPVRSIGFGGNGSDLLLRIVIK